MVHTDYTRPAAPGHGCFPSSSNGLASGNSVIEATCHALCELIERDATSVWHHLPAEARGRTRVRSGSVDDPACAEAIGRIESAGIDLAFWETTTDVGVAAFRAVIAEPGTQPGHIGIGDGCHPSRGIALLRALTEAVQTRMTYISGARDDMTPDEFTPEALASKDSFVRAMFEQGEPGRDFAEAPHRDAETFEDDLGWLTARLADAGCGQVLTVDLTQPGIGISVVRAVVPGLEAPHDDDGYVPGARATAAAGHGT
jgi:ribosomal protein S12 methylthiotransferase accessory factor